MFDRETRRAFLGKGTRLGLAGMALQALLPATAQEQARSLATNNGPGYSPGNPGPTHFPAKAKRVIYLCQSGAPSQIDTFDYKPTLEKLNGKELPASIRDGQRLTGMTS